MVVYGAKDPLNIFGKRNLENTDMFDYNCGGFALGTFSWYLPCPRHADHKNYFGFLSAQEAEKKTEKCVQFMLAEVPGLRRLRSKDDHLMAIFTLCGIAMGSGSTSGATETLLKLWTRMKYSAKTGATSTTAPLSCWLRPNRDPSFERPAVGWRGPSFVTMAGCTISGSKFWLF